MGGITRRGGRLGDETMGSVFSTAGSISLENNTAVTAGRPGPADLLALRASDFTNLQ